MFHLHPGQNQKSGVVGEEANIAASSFSAPADKAIAAAQVTGRRTPGQAGDRTPSRPHQVLQMFAHWLLVTQVMMLFDQAVEQRLIPCTPYRLDLEGPPLT